MLQTISEMGFEKCDFAPDADTCDSCSKPNLQLYFAESISDGRYCCESCIVDEHAANQRDVSAAIALPNGAK